MNFTFKKIKANMNFWPCSSCSNSDIQTSPKVESGDKEKKGAKKAAKLAEIKAAKAAKAAKQAEKGDKKSEKEEKKSEANCEYFFMRYMRGK